MQRHDSKCVVASSLQGDSWTDRHASPYLAAASTAAAFAAVIAVAAAAAPSRQ